MTDRPCRFHVPTILFWVVLALLPVQALALVGLPSPDWSAPAGAPVAPGDAFGVTFSGRVPAANSPIISWTASSVIKINTGDTGDGNLGGYLIDQFYSGGSTTSNGATVNLSIDPLPNVWIAKYYRYGSSFSYTIPSLVANNSYKVRLHFCEPTYTAANQRKFSIIGNGTALVSNYDIWAEVGKNKAVYHDYNVTSNSASQIVLQFTGVTSTALVCALEVSDNCNWKDAPNPVLHVAQFRGTVGVAASSIDINIANLGVANCTWSVYSASQPWITANVQSGGTVAPEAETGVLRVSIDTSSMSAGYSYGTVTLTTSTGKTFYAGVEANLVAAQVKDRISDVKSLADGVVVSIISPKVATVASGVFSDGSSYLEESDRSCGIKVTGARLALWENVTVTGAMSTDSNGERVLSILSVDSRTPGEPVAALGMSDSSVTAKGLLVRAWGKVTDIEPDYFLIDDGSGPLRIPTTGLTAPLTVIITAGNYVGVTGPAGKGDGGIVVVKPRADADIMVF